MENISANLNYFKTFLKTAYKVNDKLQAFLNTTFKGIEQKFTIDGDQVVRFDTTQITENFSEPLFEVPVYIKFNQTRLAKALGISVIMPTTETATETPDFELVGVITLNLYDPTNVFISITGDKDHYIQPQKFNLFNAVISEISQILHATIKKYNTEESKINIETHTLYDPAERTNKELEVIAPDLVKFLREFPNKLTTNLVYEIALAKGSGGLRSELKSIAGKLAGVISKVYYDNWEVFASDIKQYWFLLSNAYKHKVFSIDPLIFFKDTETDVFNTAEIKQKQKQIGTAILNSATADLNEMLAQNVSEGNLVSTLTIDYCNYVLAEFVKRIRTQAEAIEVAGIPKKSSTNIFSRFLHFIRAKDDINNTDDNKDVDKEVSRIKESVEQLSEAAYPDYGDKKPEVAEDEEVKSSEEYLEDPSVVNEEDTIQNDTALADLKEKGITIIDGKYFTMDAEGTPYELTDSELRKMVGDDTIDYVNEKISQHDTDFLNTSENNATTQTSAMLFDKYEKTFRNEHDFETKKYEAENTYNYLLNFYNIVKRKAQEYSIKLDATITANKNSKKLFRIAEEKSKTKSQIFDTLFTEQVTEPTESETIPGKVVEDTSAQQIKQQEQANTLEFAKAIKSDFDSIKNILPDDVRTTLEDAMFPSGDYSTFDYTRFIAVLIYEIRIARIFKESVRSQDAALRLRFLKNNFKYTLTPYFNKTTPQFAKEEDIEKSTKVMKQKEEEFQKIEMEELPKETKEKFITLLKKFVKDHKVTVDIDTEGKNYDQYLTDKYLKLQAPGSGTPQNTETYAFLNSAYLVIDGSQFISDAAENVKQLFVSYYKEVNAMKRTIKKDPLYQMILAFPAKKLFQLMVHYIYVVEKPYLPEPTGIGAVTLPKAVHFSPDSKISEIHEKIETIYTNFMDTINQLKAR